LYSGAEGIAVEVSRAGFDHFDRRKEKTIQFFTEHNAGLSQLATVPNNEIVCMDFAVAYELTFHSYRLPSALLRLAGALNIDMEISVYPSGPTGQ
jgi:hypothetical protein